MLRDSPEAGATGPSLAPLNLSLCRIVTHQLSLGHSLPQSGQICPPAPLLPAVWKKHTGIASQNQETRVHPSLNHYSELVPLSRTPPAPSSGQDHSIKPPSSSCPGKDPKLGLSFLAHYRPRLTNKLLSPKKKLQSFNSQLGPSSRSTTTIALEAIWTSTQAGIPPG